VPLEADRDKVMVIPGELGADRRLTPAAFQYSAFGLNIRSEMECSCLLPGVGVPNVYVQLGSVPAQLENPVATGVFFQAANGRLLLDIENVGRYLVSSGSEIVVDVEPGADPDTVSLFLLGSAFGALLHQRRVLALHGSAIVTRRGAVVFAGASGYGKSTIAGAFHRRGFPILADEVCPISVGDVPIVLPANPFLMLWADAAERLGVDQQLLRRARSGLEKFILPLGDGFAAEPVPLHGVYLLELSDSEDFSLVPVNGFQKFKTLSLATYRPLFVAGMNLGSQHFRQIGEVARQAKIAVVKRPPSGFRVDELADLLAADFTA
jgi:hypothetical protein